MSRKGFLLVIGLILLVVGSADAQTADTKDTEASGVAMLNGDIVFVGDAQKADGKYYVCPVNLQSENPKNVFLLNNCTQKSIPTPSNGTAQDLTQLEAIDVTSSGKALVLSEQTRKLSFETGTVEVVYSKDFDSTGNRGMEGLAIRQISGNNYKIAVLWEGGYPDVKKLLGGPVPTGIPGYQFAVYAGKSALPQILEREITLGDNIIDPAKSSDKLIPLMITQPVHNAKGNHVAFRGTDLVWNDQGNNKFYFIVLMSTHGSTGGKPYDYSCLREFTHEGKETGRSVNLKDYLRNTLNVPFGSKLLGANWEGLAWYQENVSLILIHDFFPGDEPSVFVVPVTALNTKNCPK